jgi:hypothetical protein
MTDITSGGSHTFGGHSFEVDLPSGGKLHLQAQEEVDLWEESHKRYVEDYGFQAQNDLVLLGAILTQQLAMYRAQIRMNGMEPEFDNAGLPTGNYKKTNLKASDMSAAQSIVTKSAAEIRELEKSLGVDKKTREAGGQVTVASYVGTLKEAAREYGIHISKRLKAYEKFNMELRWKLRLNANGDVEDKAYHDISPEKICAWAQVELGKLEEVDKEFAKTKGALYMGKLR